MQLTTVREIYKNRETFLDKRTITKKQRDMLALLGLENPPRVLKN